MTTTTFFPQIGHSSAARRPGESAFNFLARLDSPQAGALRSRIEMWLQTAPDEFRRRSLNGLLSTEDWNHDAAMFELFLHQFLVDSGMPIVDYEPIIGGNKPDFLVEWPDKQLVLVEATIIERTSREEAIEEDFQHQIWQSLQELPESDRAFHLSFVGTFQSQPRIKRVAQSILNQMSLDPSKEKYSHTECGVTVIVKEVARREEGSTGQTVGMASIGRSGFFYPQGRLRDKISKKYKQVRRFDGPKVVAISCSALEFGLDVFSMALFGDEQFTFLEDSETQRRISRKGNGLFIHQGSPQLRGLSGVLLFDRNSTLGFAEKSPIYFEHPWAKWKLDGSAFPATRLNPDPDMKKMVATPLRGTH